MFFDGLDTELSSCIGDGASRKSEKPVNHPDTFEQVEYRYGDVSVTLSLKDKNALRETYVFLGVGWSDEAK